MTIETKMTTLLDNAKDNDCNVTHQQLIGDITKNFTACIKKTHQHKQELAKDVHTTAKKISKNIDKKNQCHTSE